VTWLNTMTRPPIEKVNRLQMSTEVKQSDDRTGKPDAVKVARPVWSGGKAEKPYLSLQGAEKPLTYPVPHTERIFSNEIQRNTGQR
jgi:hypothetical protein